MRSVLAFLNRGFRLSIGLILFAILACTSGGDPDENAGGSAAPLSFLADHESGPVDPAHVDADGVVLDRIAVLWSPDADAADFDTVLAMLNGTIGSSRPGMAWTTIMIPPVADRAAAQAVVDRIADAPGVLYARVGWQPVSDAGPEALEANGNPALGTQRFFAAWSASRLARTRVSVFVADLYTENTAPPQLSTQRFVGPEAPTVQVRENGSFAGNHGFWVTSLLGADVDGRSPVGTHPSPATTLEITSINVLGTGEIVDLHLALDRALPISRFFILNTSLGLPETIPPLDRVMAALSWREIILRRRLDFLHTASAGNDAKTADVARLSSEWVAQSRAADLRTLLTGEDRDDFEEIWSDALTRTDGRSAAIAGHTLVVGASDAVGAEVDFSNRGSDVRMVGMDLIGVCEREDLTCVDSPFGRLLDENGTSGAAPQVAGLAAWLRAIDPTLDAAALRARILTAFDGRWVDALAATLALEPGGGAARRAWVNYFPDDAFDENDLVATLTEIDAGDAAPVDALPTWPIGDFNGDGFARSSSTGSADLDNDGVLGALVVQIPGDEAAITEDLLLTEADLTDLDILCWAAYGGLYEGDEAARDELLAARCQPPLGFDREGHITFTEEVRNTAPPCLRFSSTAELDLAADADGTLRAISGTFSFSHPALLIEREGTFQLTLPSGFQSNILYFTAGPPGGRLFAGMMVNETIDGVPQPTFESGIALSFVETEDGSWDFNGEQNVGGFCQVFHIGSGVMSAR